MRRGVDAFVLWEHSALSAVNIDLAGSTLLLRPSKSAKSAVPKQAQQQEWYIAQGNRAAPLPQKVTAAAEPQQEQAVDCPAPCPDRASDWAVVGSTSRRPVWADGWITESDYPQELRAQGREGTVKVEVLIDAEGYVRGVNVISSTDPRFTAVVVEKLKKARFDPALDSSGRPIAVRMAMPIIFELR